MTSGIVLTAVMLAVALIILAGISCVIAHEWRRTERRFRDTRPDPVPSDRSDRVRVVSTDEAEPLAVQALVTPGAPPELPRPDTRQDAQILQFRLRSPR